MTCENNHYCIAIMQYLMCICICDGVEKFFMILQFDNLSYVFKFDVS